MSYTVIRTDIDTDEETSRVFPTLDRALDYVHDDIFYTLHDVCGLSWTESDHTMDDEGIDDQLNEIAKIEFAQAVVISDEVERRYVINRNY